MKLSRIILSRALRLLRAVPSETGIFVPDFVRSFQEQFRFVEVPTKLDEFDTSKGATFRHGMFDGVVIDIFRIYHNGVMAESNNAPTDLCDRFIDAALAWAAEKFKFVYAEEDGAKRMYLSEIELKPERDVLKGLARLASVGELISGTLSTYGVAAATPHRPSGVLLATNFTEEGTSQAARFVLERRSGVPFERNVFFSSAPLATSDHLKVLQALEEALA